MGHFGEQTRQITMVVRLARIWHFAVLLCFASGSAASATRELARAIMDAVPWDESSPNLEQRKKFALAIEAYWVEFDRRVPRLSPRDREWVEGELSTQGDRLSRAFASDEFAIWSLNQHTDQCLSTIRNVLGSYETEKTQQVEMFYWLKMVNCYNGTSDLLIYLDQIGLLYNDEAGKGIQMQLSNVIHQTM